MDGRKSKTRRTGGAEQEEEERRSDATLSDDDGDDRTVGRNDDVDSPQACAKRNSPDGEERADMEKAPRATTSRDAAGDKRSLAGGGAQGKAAGSAKLSKKDRKAAAKAREQEELDRVVQAIENAHLTRDPDAENKENAEDPGKRKEKKGQERGKKEKGQGQGGGREEEVGKRADDLRAQMDARLAENDQAMVELALQLCKARYELVADPDHPPPPEASPGKFKHLGISADERKTANELLIAKLVHLEPRNLIQLMTRLWDLPERDYQYFVLALLVHTCCVIIRDETGRDLFWPMMRHFVVTKSDRDTVDALARQHLCALVYLEPSLTWPVMDKWAVDEDSAWLRRAAILHQTGLGKFVDKDRLFKYCQYNLSKSLRNESVLDDAIVLALERFAETYTDKVGIRIGFGSVVNFLDKQFSVMNAPQKKHFKALQERLRPQMENEHKENKRRANKK